MYSSKDFILIMQFKRLALKIARFRANIKTPRAFKLFDEFLLFSSERRRELP